MRIILQRVQSVIGKDEKNVSFWGNLNFCLWRPKNRGSSHFDKIGLKMVATVTEAYSRSPLKSGGPSEYKRLKNSLIQGAYLKQ